VSAAAADVSCACRLPVRDADMVARAARPCRAGVGGCRPARLRIHQSDIDRSMVTVVIELSFLLVASIDQKNVGATRTHRRTSPRAGTVVTVDGGIAH
jgi:hypothetical protein